MVTSSHPPGSLQGIRLFQVIWLVSALIITAVGAYPAEYLAYVGTYTGKGSEGILLRIDPKDGRLTPTDRSLAVVSPVCIQFVSFEEVAQLYHSDTDRLFRRKGATPSDRTSPTRDD